MKKIKVALLDDESLIVSLISNYLDNQKNIEVIFASTDGDDFLKKIALKNHLPDVVILDLKLKGKNGSEIASFIKNNYPEVSIIIMSSYYKQSFIGFMLKTGAAAFIPKGINPDELLNIVEEVFSRGYYFMNDQLETIREQLPGKSLSIDEEKPDILSKREIEILKLICFQKTAKEIAKLLFIAPKTVEGHKNRLFSKTGTKNVAGLVMYAIQNKYVNSDEAPLF